MAVGSSSTGIASTFERVDRPTAAMAFEGSHTRGEYRVVREYYVVYGAEVLQENTSYYDEGHLVGERTGRWLVDRRSNTVRRSGRSVEEFCRRRHMADPRADVGYVGHVGDRSDGPDRNV
jgi:hypothetical protein